MGNHFGNGYGEPGRQPDGFPGQNGGGVARHAGSLSGLYRGPAQRQRAGRRPGKADAGIRRQSPPHRRGVYRPGNCRGALYGREQRLYAPYCGRPYRRSLRRNARCAHSSVLAGQPPGGKDAGGHVYRQRHRRGHRLPGRYLRSGGRLSGGDRQRLLWSTSRGAPRSRWPTPAPWR